MSDIQPVHNSLIVWKFFDYYLGRSANSVDFPISVDWLWSPKRLGCQDDIPAGDELVHNYVFIRWWSFLETFVWKVRCQYVTELCMISNWLLDEYYALHILFNGVISILVIKYIIYYIYVLYKIITISIS